ncbi:LrgB family protein [Seongchinamella sediminis]
MSGPATVALAVPLYREFHRIREMAKPFVVSWLTTPH